MLKGKDKMIPYILLIIYVLFSSLGMVLIKKGGSNSHVSITSKNFEISITWVVVLGLLMYLISFILWIVVLQLFPLTYISPIAYGLVFISIAVFSYFILGIKLTKGQLVGAAFIIMGIFFGSTK